MTTLEPSKNSRYIVLDALGILAQSLGPIAARRLKAGGIRHFNANGRSNAVRDLSQTRDASRVLAAMRSYWNEAFEPHFEYGESRRVRQLVAQVIDIRNTYEGHPVGDYRYADEALVDIRRLLEAFSAVEGVQQVSALKQELARLWFGDAPPEPQPEVVPPAAPKSIPDSEKPASAPAGVWKPGQSARSAIEQSLRVDQLVPTPSRRSYFTIKAIDHRGVRIDKLNSEYMTWEELDSVPPYMQARQGCVRIGATHTAQAQPDTLEICLRNAGGSQTSKGSYVAAVLAEACIVEYAKVAGSRAMHVRLLPPFTG